MNRVSVGGLLGFLATSLGACADEQQPPSGNGAEQQLAAAAQSLEAGDTVGYRDHLRAAVPLLPDGALDRPFQMYRLARAEAMTGRPDSAAQWLQTAWDENIEGMMISFALIDRAFAPWLEHPAIASVLKQMEDFAVSVDTLAPGVYRLDAAGPKLLAVAGDGATILIDAGYAPAAAAIRRVLGKVGAPPVGYVINTHAHEDHVGGNAAFGTQAIIFAHPAVRQAMTEVQPFTDGVTVPPRSGDALPERTISEDTSLGIAGVTVRVFPLPAHTTGDLLVYLPGSHVLHMGDNFFPHTGRGMVFPGAAPERFVEDLHAFLDQLPDDTRVVAGHDPVVPLSALREQFARTVQLVERTRAAVDGGLSVDSTVAVLVPEGFRESWIRYLHRVMGGDGS